jgi:hypothetical protein
MTSGSSCAVCETTVALVVRQGNPKNIQSFDDLTREGVQVSLAHEGRWWSRWCGYRSRDNTLWYSQWSSRLSTAQLAAPAAVVNHMSWLCGEVP